jgi:DNA helicase II / ATP-dependent DNA helicase PcrA
MAKVPLEDRKLNPEQKNAVEFGEGPLLIIAGAGTGKTTVVTERIKYLISSGHAKPTEILALTFTEKASREMEERVEVSLPYGLPQMWISTFHAFCDRILRAEAINIGMDPGYKLMTDADTIQFFRKHLFDFKLNYFRPLGNPTKFISGMIQHFSRLKDEDVTPKQYIEWVNSKGKSSTGGQKSPLGKTQGKQVKSQNDEVDEDYEKNIELANAYRLYEEFKVKDGVADYGDLITNVLKIFRTRPKILQKYQNQFKYFLIDEFQDTNFAQNELAVLLSGNKKNITVVGDDDQAIYKWRGAAVSNIIQFRKRFPKLTVIVLTQNYRSTKEILDRSYDLIRKNNPDRLEVAENIDKKLFSVRRINGEKIKVFYQDRVENEAEIVAKEIRSLHDTEKSDYSWSDFTILVRANSYSEPFTRALSRAGIPFQFLGPGQLFKQSEVKDLIAYLKVLYNFEDSVAMYRILTMDYFAINARDIASMIIYSKKFGISLFETAEIVSGNAGKRVDLTNNPIVLPETKVVVGQLVSMISRHLELMKKDTAGQILYFFLEDTGMLKQFVAFKTMKEERVAGNIAKFFDKLKTYETDHEDASVYAVVDWIDLAMTIGESPMAANSDWTGNDAVNIMTVHSSKGLEFPVVFVVNLVSQRFPSNDKKEQIPIPDELVKEILPEGDSHLEEERRLFYVAMTRARDLLYFTASKYYGEGKREKKLSQFIGETVGEDQLSAVSCQTIDKNNQLFLFDWEKVPESPDTKTVRQKITFLSYSQIDSFTTCPLQYKYRSILKIPVPPRAALSFGEVVHVTLKNFYELVIAGIKPSEKLLLDTFEKNWTPVGYGNQAYAEKMKKQGIDLLIGFYQKGFNPEIIPLNLEQNFKIKISPTLTIGGKIDRVDPLPGDKIEIIDYKTGQASKSKDPRTDRQLSVYALAATDVGMYDRNPKDVVVSFYYFDTQEKISATRNQDEIEQTKADILKVAGDIEKSDFKPTPGRHCDFCDFRLICEAWN